MKRIYLTGNRGKGHFALVDDEDFVRLSTFNWSLHSQGYAQACHSIKGKKIYYFMHRMVVCFIPPNRVVDHRDLNRLNNQRSNLRICTQKLNCANTRQKTTTGYRGVHWAAHAGKYRVMLKGLDKQRHVGYFVDVIEAATAYNTAALALYGDFAKLNDIHNAMSASPFEPTRQVDKRGKTLLPRGADTTGT